MKSESLKLLRDVVWDLELIIKGDIVTTFADAQDTAKNALDSLRAAVFMETPNPSSKINLYDIADDDNGSRPMMGCVHYENGYAVASDTHILVCLKQDYANDLEGRSINKRGEDEEGRYPNFMSLYNTKLKEAEEYKIDFDQLRNWMKEYNAERKIHGKEGARKSFVKIGDAFYYLPLLYKFVNVMRSVGTDVLHVEENRRPAGYFTEDGGWGVIMPSVRTSIDYRDISLAELWEKKDDRVMIWEAA